MFYVIYFKSLQEWGPEGYQLWGVKGKSTEEIIEQNKKGKEKKSSVILFQFAKSALTVNPGMVCSAI